MISDWRPVTEKDIQEDIKAVHNKALRYSTTVDFKGSHKQMIEASSSSFGSVPSRNYAYRDTNNFDTRYSLGDKIGRNS